MSLKEWLIPWVPEVFSRAQCDQFSVEGRTTIFSGTAHSRFRMYST